MIEELCFLTFSLALNKHCNKEFIRYKPYVSSLESTLEWESFEQQCVWHLIQAEDVLLESFVNILPSLKQNQHAEALANLLILMKSVS